MPVQVRALIWATIIIAFAIFAKTQGLSDGASIGIVAGLSGAAIGSLSGKTGCSKVCTR